MLPWKLLEDSNSFTSYLSAYSVFLSSIAGVMVRVKDRGKILHFDVGLMSNNRLPTTTSFVKVIIVSRICTIPGQMDGITTLSASTSGATFSCQLF